MTTNQKIIFGLMLFTIGVVGRMLPHLWNATPLVAVALFAGTYLGLRHSIFLIIAIMFVSDIFIGFYEPELMVTVYSSFAIVGLLGYFIGRHKNWTNIFLTSMASSIIFFLTTNWAVWQFSPWYEQTFDGLIKSYVLALPFFRNMFFGDLIYVGVLFGIYELVFLGVKKQKLQKIKINNYLT